MDANVLEENLREASCNGDLLEVKKLVSQGVSVNSKNPINGWTALHWAAKRGHLTLVQYLLSAGADKDSANAKGEKPLALTNNPEILQLLDADSDEHHMCSGEPLPITPNYLQHPTFPHTNKSENYLSDEVYNIEKPSQQSPTMGTEIYKEIVLKARIANTTETDFIEIELDIKSRSYENLIRVMCLELRVDRNLVQKIRKLPNTIIRKDKDILRLVDFQELELVLTNKVISASSRNYLGHQASDPGCAGANNGSSSLLY